ncbi:MAG: carbon starvation protein A [Candidatus Krumholzibacteria bacterium]|nr:carbon starvation protein A [Candidatus Krumholzibacteria bacterium]MDH4337881.1 carbon starvation protein A [Candidatus Krumholzibacteria bacterium]MDH5270234.1 carbon starvation protein A [Candidatus Krumholzibacteria bacterium]
MPLALLAIAFMTLLVVAYRLYGGWVAKQFQLDDSTETPAHAQADGVDFVPTRPFYLFAQHFSAIAAAGPIAGPILACQSFGWLPCLLWISLGVVLIGAVHDFSTLTASVRHGARSIAEIAREHLGTRSGRALMIFIWIALIYVIVAFADITAATFVVGSEELQQGNVTFNPGGAVAFASVMYLALSVLLGVVQRFLKPPLWLATVIFVPATFAVAWLGTHFSNVLVLDHKAWALIIIGYCAVASVVPVWALLQPRGYLGGFVLYSALAVGVFGLLFGGYEVQQPAFKGWNVGGMTGAMFPFLFVTIACGACSGFHGLVCSGTTCKQIDRESHMHPIGYGAMLAEGFVALIALVTIMIAAPGAVQGLAPGTIYGNGIGQFLTLIIGQDKMAFAVTFGAMAFSTFVFDTLDVSMRLGRYLLQELFGWQHRAGAIGATLATVAIPTYFLAFGESGSWLKFWTIFGTSNQLLAALSLLVITVWLKQARKRIAFTLLPMLFVLTITLWSITKLFIANLRIMRGFDIAFMNAFAAVVLVLLALFLVVSALLKLRVERGGGALAGQVE